MITHAICMLVCGVVLCRAVPCRAIVSNADVNQKGTFLSDSLRGALPEGSKNKGTPSTKPTVPRSVSQPGNHQREKVRNRCV